AHGEDRRRQDPHRDRHQALSRRGAGARAAEAHLRRRAARPRRRAALPRRARRTRRHHRRQGHRAGRPRTRRDAARVLQRHGQGGPHRRLARGLHLRTGEGDGGRADPQAHRPRRGEAGGASAHAPRASV
ncbi:MAG: hypothetical protein AVDCRST_MAG67-2606, partial [uncultured Solirubrobacteraceae bacterium]